MTSPDEARAAVATARSEVRAAIEEVAGRWEVALAAEGEWSAREASGHLLMAEIYFATAVCEACGYEGPANPVGTEPAIGSAAEALSAWSQVVDAADSKIKYVTVEDLERRHEEMGTVAEIMTKWAEHAREHAAQIRAAGGA